MFQLVRLRLCGQLNNQLKFYSMKNCDNEINQCVNVDSEMQKERIEVQPKKIEVQLEKIKKEEKNEMQDIDDLYNLMITMDSAKKREYYRELADHVIK